MPAVCARRSLCRGPGLITVLLAELVLAPSVWAQQQKQVLVLYSTRRDAQIAVVGDRELPRMLDAGLNRQLDYYSEYIDAARFPDPDYRTGFHDFVQLKYQGRRFDLVIAMSDLALEFAAMNRQEFFPETPIVYFASSPETQRVANSTGVVALPDMRGTLALAASLQPDVRQVFVVSGADSGDQQYLKMTQEQLEPFAHRLTITYLTGLPTKDLEARLAALPLRSIVYYLVVNRDGAGQNFHPLEYLDRLAKISNAPIYSWVDSAMDHGIVGGSLKSQMAETKAVGQLALRVLAGESAGDIPIASMNLNTSQVDWRQLRRWRISDAHVPSGTLIRFRERGVWEIYKVYIVGALVTLSLQSALISGLLIQRGRRQRAENALRASQSELRSSYQRIRDLGARLLQAQETERARIARELHDDISQQASLLAIDLSLLRGAAGPETEELTDEAVHRAGAIVKSVHDLSHRLHPAKLRLFGLVPALCDLQRELSHADVPIIFTHDEVLPELPDEVTLCLFRVAQEGVQNALKYSHARHITVRLNGGAQELALLIADDGVGFDVDSASGTGLGLISIAERLDTIGGKFKIRSSPGAGTTLQVRVPLRVVKQAQTIAVI
jgi:signal transduction histidine kinase